LTDARRTFILSLMKTAASKTVREFRVEAHGAHTLAMFGAVLGAFGREPLLTRDGAWSTVRHLLASDRDIHTVKVFRGGSLVWRAFRQVDGSWVDANTALPVAA